MAEKLDQVPVPDMADSVWASIGMQLDMGAGAPDQVDDAPEKRSASRFKGKGWYGFLGVVVVVVATLWWYYNHKLIPVVNETVPVPVADTINRNKKKNIDVPAAPAGVKKDTPLFNKVPAVSAGIDSTFRQDLPLPVKVDSSSLYKDWVPVPLFDSLSVKPRGKKPRGVKGIRDDDYKISAGKERN